MQMKRKSIFLISLFFCLTIKSSDLRTIGVLKRVTSNNFVAQDKESPFYNGRLNCKLKRAVSQPAEELHENKQEQKHLERDALEIQNQNLNMQLYDFKTENKLTQNHFSLQHKRMQESEKGLQKKEDLLTDLEAKLRQKDETIFALQEKFKQCKNKKMQQKKISEEWRNSYKEMKQKLQEKEDQFEAKFSELSDHCITLQALCDIKTKELGDFKKEKVIVESKISEYRHMIESQTKEKEINEICLKNEILIGQLEKQLVEIDCNFEIDQSEKNINAIATQVLDEFIKRDQILKQKNILLSEIQNKLQLTEKELANQKKNSILFNQLLAIIGAHHGTFLNKNEPVTNEDLTHINTLVQEKTTEAKVLKKENAFLKNKLLLGGLGFSFLCACSWGLLLLKIKSHNRIT
jgi:hypothetical protein